MSNYLVAGFLLAGAVSHARARCIDSAFAFSGQVKQNFVRTRFSAKSSLCMMADQKIRVFLVRHGAVDLNSPGMVYPKDCFYGGQNVPLSSLGKVEAQAAADFLKKERIDMVFSSPLSRALYGAERIAANYGLTPIQDDRFREINRGRWLGLTKEQVRERFPGDLESFDSDPDWGGHGGETYSQLSARVLAGRDAALAAAAACGAETVCLVSHMHVTKAVIADARGYRPAQQDKWGELKVPTASVSLLEYPTRGAQSAQPVILFVGTKPPIPAAESTSGAAWGG